jgi:AcrR family transcriptional regulator
MTAQTYSDDFILGLIDRVRGGESLRAVAADVGISRQTFYNRLNDKPELRKIWEKALADCGDAWAEKADDIVNDMLAGKLEPKKAAVALDHMRWRAEKANPQRYGQRQTLEHKGDTESYVDAMRRAQPLIKAVEPTEDGKVVSLPVAGKVA